MATNMVEPALLGPHFGEIDVEEADRVIHFTTPGAGGSAVSLIVEALAKGETVWAHANFQPV